jgi:hypothetical protein
MAHENAGKLSVILTAQIVHELRNLPRGKIPEETVLLFETAYRLGVALEDVLKGAYKSKGHT